MTLSISGAYASGNVQEDVKQIATDRIRVLVRFDLKLPSNDPSSKRPQKSKLFSHA